MEYKIRDSIGGATSKNTVEMPTIKDDYLLNNSSMDPATLEDTWKTGDRLMVRKSNNGMEVPHQTY